MTCVCVWWFRDFFFHVLWNTRRDEVKKMSRFHTLPIQMAVKNHGALLRLEHIVSLLSRQATSASSCRYHFEAHVVYTYIIINIQWYIEVYIIHILCWNPFQYRHNSNIWSWSFHDISWLKQRTQKKTQAEVVYMGFSSVVSLSRSSLSGFGLIC